MMAYMHTQFEIKAVDEYELEKKLEQQRRRGEKGKKR